MNRETSRRIVVCLLALALTTSLATTVAAVSSPREAPDDKSPPVTVYVSETLDISDVRMTGGGTIGNDTTTFVGVASGRTFSVNPPSADFDDLESGTYYASKDRDVRAELRLVQPRVTDLVVRNERGVNVTGDTVPPDDLEELRIMARYTFADADRLDVTVDSPSGVDLAGNRRITSSGQTVVVDVGDVQPGTYTVTVEGSNIEAGTKTARVTVAGDATPTSTATPSATPTPTPTATPTATPTSTATPSATPTPTPTPTATATPTPTPTPTGGDGVGFGVTVTLLALAAATLLLWRGN